jgi:DNA repair protein RadC
MRAANLIGIPILDHIIVTRDRQPYHSMYERGTLPVIAE